MQTASITLGIISITGMAVAFIPCLGWLNWFVLPVAFAGLIVSVVATVTSNDYNKSSSIAGIILCSATLVFGTIRWVLGGFIL